MATQQGEAYLDWLEREEERLGFAAVDTGLADIKSARDLLYEELGYDVTEKQFEALKDAVITRYEELPSIGISYDRVEHAWGYQDTYRDIITGRFTAKADVFDLLAGAR